MVNGVDYRRACCGGGSVAWLIADISVYVSVPAARDHVALSLYDVDVERSVPPTPVVGRRGTFLRRAAAERREMSQLSSRVRPSFSLSTYKCTRPIHVEVGMCARERVYVEQRRRLTRNYEVIRLLPTGNCVTRNCKSSTYRFDATLDSG